MKPPETLETKLQHQSNQASTSTFLRAGRRSCIVAVKAPKGIYGGLLSAQHGQSVVKRGLKGLVVGVPKETLPGEERVVLDASVDTETNQEWSNS